MHPLLAGTIGGVLTTWVTFMPCFLWIFLGAPFAEALRGNKALSAGLSAISAAVVGVILNLAIWFAMHTLFREIREVAGPGFRFDLPVPASVHLPALLLTLAALIAVFRYKVGTLAVLAACAAAGILLWLAGAR
jgi:chromate transporter